MRGDLSPAQLEGCGISATGPTAWPQIDKPTRWVGTRRSVEMCGRLPGAPFDGSVEPVELGQLISAEVQANGGYGTPPAGLPTDDHEMEPGALTLLGYATTAVERELDALDRQIAAAHARQDALIAGRREAEHWVAEHAHMLNVWAKADQRLDFTAIWADGQHYWEQAYLEQRRAQIHNRPIPPGAPSCATAVRSFAAMAWWFDHRDRSELPAATATGTNDATEGNSAHTSSAPGNTHASTRAGVSTDSGASAPTKTT
jgi:hypothetical protein